jgi:hypothetical protein
MRHDESREILGFAMGFLARFGAVRIMQVRTSNQDVIAFYCAIGFNVDDVLSMGKRIIPD